MAKKAKKRAYKVWTRDDLKDLKQHSRAKTPVAKISKALKRTVGALRQKARHLGIAIGHRQQPKRRSRRG